MRDGRIYRVWLKERDDLGFGRNVTTDGIIKLPERRIDDWTPMVYELQDGGFADYQANNDGLRVCSPRLRAIIEENKSENDVVQWLDVVVRDDREERLYYVLHYPEIDDVLATGECVYSERTGELIKARLSEDLCRRYNLITFRGDTRFSIALFVRGSVRKAIIKSGCTGMRFERERLAESGLCLAGGVR